MMDHEVECDDLLMTNSFINVKSSEEFYIGNTLPKKMKIVTEQQCCDCGK